MTVSTVILTEVSELVEKDVSVIVSSVMKEILVTGVIVVRDIIVTVLSESS